MDILSDIGDLIKLIFNGVTQFVDFIKNIPDLFYNLVKVVPQPFYTYLYDFISIFLFLIVVYACSKIISSVRGG